MNATARFASPAVGAGQANANAMKIPFDMLSDPTLSGWPRGRCFSKG